MNNENVVNLYHGILCSYKEKFNHEVNQKIDGTANIILIEIPQGHKDK